MCVYTYIQIDIVIVIGDIGIGIVQPIGAVFGALALTRDE